MFDLLFPITLDPAEKGLHLILLLRTKCLLLLNYFDVKLLLHVVDLLLLEGLANEFDLLSIDVVLDGEVDPLLLPQLNDLLVPPMIIVELFCYYFAHFFKLSHLTNFEVLD